MYSRRQIVLALASASAATLCAVPGALAKSKVPIVAAAASLRSVLPEIARAFEQQTGSALRLSFASSGSLSRQIRQGAPFELFLSADEGFVLELARDRVTPDSGILYAEGGLAIIASNDSPIATDSALAGLRAGLRSGQLRRLAIANPEHAPYGRATREALVHENLWEVVQPKLVFGENVSQAAQFAASQSCEAALTALSIALSPAFSGKVRFSALPRTWHKPLRQRMVLLADAGATVRGFYAFLRAETAQAIFARHGFLQPGGI